MEREMNLFKRTFIFFMLFLCSTLLVAENYDYLKTGSATVSAVTSGDELWSNVGEIATFDVTDISNLLVMASIDMWPSGSSSNGREVNYKFVVNGTMESGAIRRQVQAIDDNDHGLGSLVHIFDVSALSGNISIVLKHMNSRGDNERNVESSAYLNAIALTTETYGYELSNDNVEIGVAGVTTTSSSFEAVTGMTTDAITVHRTGDVYVAASISSYARGDTDVNGEWTLQSSSDNVLWTNIGLPIQRTMSISADDGMVSLVALAQDLNVGSYYFRLAHKRATASGTVYTVRSNLIAVSLTHSDNGYFNSFYEEVTSDFPTTTTNASYTHAASSEITTGDNIDGVNRNILVHSQFNMQATGLGAADEMLTKYNISYSSGDMNFAKRLLPDNNDTGSGVSIGLASQTPANTLCQIHLNHGIETTPAVGTLTTSNIILTGFDTFNSFAVEDPGSTPITLSDFSAELNNDRVDLSWITESENENMGFNIYKNGDLIGSFMNSPVLLGHGTCSEPHNYSFSDLSIIPGKSYVYTLSDVANNNSETLHSDKSISISIPKMLTASTENYKLCAAYPNPFNPTFTLPFDLEISSIVKASLYNVNGDMVQVICDDSFSSGHYSIPVSTSGLSSGIYLLNIQVGNDRHHQKLLLMK